ncbi:hypothetical protein [Paenibacillus sp.]|uniref:hypothetical protein n=1 Tax=Paenibacillus sp. TaxID=58172 RepID=UPI0028AA19C1|nr:hypothetical protein [Paenibacillus sp.]
MIDNPVVLDRDQIEQDLRGGNQVIIQFSHPDFYGSSILEEVYELLNLQHFKAYTYLEHLHVGGKVKNLDAIGDLEDLNYLALLLDFEISRARVILAQLEAK